jgi:phosphatidylethanolamine/phosphatidyl-N-methylethanolamine N-methyltransferase
MAYYTLVSPIYDFITCMDEVPDARKKLLDGLHIPDGSRIIECCAGTGKNIGLYPQDSELHLIEQNPSMIRRAMKKARKLKRDGIFFHEQDSRKLDSVDCYFDFGVLTYALSATVNNYLVLDEIVRVMKPGGKLGILDFNESINALGFALMRSLDFLLKTHPSLSVEDYTQVCYDQSAYIMSRKGFPASRDSSR